MSIYQNTVGFPVHLAIVIYNSKILGEFISFCARVLYQVKVSFIAKVVHTLRSLAFKSSYIANRQSVASLFRQFWLLLSLVLGASLFRLFWCFSSQNVSGIGSNATGEKLKWGRASIACRWPDFCFVKSQQNQRGAKLAILGSNSCTTSSLCTAAGFLCQCGSLYLTFRSTTITTQPIIVLFLIFLATLHMSILLWVVTC